MSHRAYAGFSGGFFFCPLRICIFSFLYLCWFYNLHSVPYVFLFCCVLVFSEFGGLVFGNLVFCCNDFFWYVVIFACAPGIYFDILVAFIIVMLYEVYYFWYVVSSLFSYCISYFGILLVFFLYFVFCPTCCIWCIVI